MPGVPSGLVVPSGLAAGPVSRSSTDEVGSEGPAGARFYHSTALYQPSDLANLFTICILTSLLTYSGENNRNQLCDVVVR